LLEASLSQVAMDVPDDLAHVREVVVVQVALIAA